jgi:hypothetical protein
MRGHIESVLITRYGKPSLAREHLDTVWTWSESNPESKSVLYEPLQIGPPSVHDGILNPVYGNFRGGFLISDSLRVSLRSGASIFGLATIDELSQYPEVRRALELTPDALYFMDAANVWFYGVCQDRLVVYDSDSDESYELGAIETALTHLLAEWEGGEPAN